MYLVMLNVILFHILNDIVAPMNITSCTFKQYEKIGAYVGMQDAFFLSGDIKN